MICQIKPTASLAAGKQKQKTHAHVRIQGTEGEGILTKKISSRESKEQCSGGINT